MHAVDSVADIEIRKERSPLSGPIKPALALFVVVYFLLKDVKMALAIAFMSHVFWMLLA
jgi:hypothetical protein